MSEAMTARAETELLIDNDYLDANANDADAVIDVVKRIPVEAFITAHRRVAPNGMDKTFHPKGVHIDNESGDADASFAWINRSVYAHQLRQNARQRYACGMTHPEAIRYIYPRTTTARGIHIKY